MKTLTMITAVALILTGCATASISQETVRSPDGTQEYNLVLATSQADLGGGARTTSTFLIGDQGVEYAHTSSGEMTANSAMPSAMLGASGVIAAKVISDGNEKQARINADGRERAARARGPENVITVEGSRAYADSYSETGDNLALGGDAFALNEDNSREYTDMYTSVYDYNDESVRNYTDIEVDGDIEIDEINVDDVEIEDVRVYND